MEFDLTKLARALGVSDSTESAIMLAAEEASATAEKLRTILQAVGVEDVDGAISRITEMMDAAARLREVMPELEGLRDFQAQTVESEIDSDVEAALTAHRLPPDMRDMLRLFRRQMPEEFCAKYPKPRPEEVHLSQTTASRSDGTQVQAGPAALPVNERGDGHLMDVSAYPGVNVTEKTIACLRATQDGFSKLPWDKQVRQAALMRRTGRVAAQ